MPALPMGKVPQTFSYRMMECLNLLPTLPLAGGLLAAPNTAEVLDLLHSTLNSDQVDDFWVGIDDM